jgi:hypothetical protein
LPNRLLEKNRKAMKVNDRITSTQWAVTILGPWEGVISGGGNKKWATVTVAHYVPSMLTAAEEDVQHMNDSGPWAK